MGFLSPWFLGGLVALGLPVYLHLLRQHKTTPKQFSSLMFFEARTQSSIKHRRLKYILLMLLRLLLLLCIAMAFATPYIRQGGAFATAGRRLMVIAIDNSYSMRVDDRLARAKREAAGLLSSRGSRDAAQILTVGSSVHALTQGTTEDGELRAALNSIQPSDSRSSYGELARALRAIEQSVKIPLDVHFFSDMQKSSLPPAYTDLRLGQSTKLVLHAMADRNTPNYAVESVNAPRSVFDTKKARVQATIASYGAPAAKRTATLLVNGKVLGTKVADVPQDGRATVEFLGLDTNYGFNKGEVRIDSADKLAGDDAFFFSVERSDPRRVLFVYEGRQPKGLLYYKAALEAASEGAFLVDGVTSDTVANVAPSKYGFVVLSDVGSLPGTFENALKDFVRGGGSLLIAAGPASAGRPKLPVFEEGVRESRYASRAGERFLVVGSMDVTHPVLRATGRWENVKFYQAMKVEQGQSRVLAKLADDTPLLLEKKLGEGRVMVFTSTLDNISNDFPLHPTFVPFIEQSARYLVGSEVRPSSYTVDSYVELRTEKATGTVEILDPKGKRALDLKEAAQARSFLLTETGFYDVGRANGRHELVAVNADRKESELVLAEPESLTLWQGTGGQPPPPGSVEAEQQRNASLWWYILLAAMLVSLFESLLASRYLNLEPTDA